MSTLRPKSFPRRGLGLSGLRRPAITAVAAALLVVPLSACGALSDSSDDDAVDENFDAVTIEHAFGETEITAKPQRVVALGWGSADAAVALGTVPIAVEEQLYGANEDGLLPWLQEGIEDQDGELPTMLTTGDEPPFQEIDEANPDLILATYSGITEADYKKLSEIADTVAYPDQPWTTPWQEVITTVGEALGETEAADQVLADIDADVAEAAEEHPEFEGQTIAAVAVTPTAFYVYAKSDPRVQFLEDLGFTSAPSVDELDPNQGFAYTISTENLDQLTSDVLVSYADNADAEEAIAEDPTYQAMDQFENDTVAEITGQDVVASVSPPTALSVGYSLDTLVEALADAVK